ncbi:ABC transporter permease [Planifilum fulgidum]|nr:ABC transporter permease [Planifilum fulgidum]
MMLAKYLLKRIALSIPVLFGISVLVFLLVRLVPGDTVTVMLGAQYNEEQAQMLREKYGLDRPVHVQYALWISNLMKGDFGHSTFTGQPVLTAILERLPVTLELTAISVLFALVVGIPLGIQAAVRRNRWMDYLATVFGLSGISIPGFWLGTLLILLFSLKWGWFPSGGYVAIWEDPLGNLQTMAMPGIALGTAVAAVVMRITRSSMLEVLDQEYIKMARIKGAPERIVVRRHALRNALIPVVTVLGIQVGYLLGGSVVIEQIFSLPGVGQLVLQAITNRDYALLQGSILFIAVSFVVINLLVDLLYTLIHPRIRY